MEIRSVLVNVDVGQPNSSSLAYAIDLAQRFGAELLGVAADEPNLGYLGTDAAGVAVDLYSAAHEAVEEKLDIAGKTFEAAVPSGVKHQWRAFVSAPARSLLECARLADVVVTPSTVTTATGESRRVDLGEVVLGAGRPVINVGASTVKARFDTVVIGWKDTREARRAVSDSLPFLKLAQQVYAYTVSEGDQRDERESLADLSSWLADHGISAKTDLLHDTAKLGDLLQITAVDQKADLLVTGAYGHSRMREWLFGGMTRSVLDFGSLSRLLSN